MTSDGLLRLTPRCRSCCTTRGWSGRSTASISADLRGLVALAEHPNVGVKVSGFYYGSRDKAEYPYAEQTAVFERIYRAFGARRLTWGSDFPVSPWVACTYAQTLDVVRLHCPFVSAADLALILGDTMAGLLETRRPLAG